MVPWVDEPIDSVYARPAPVTVAPGSKPCTAAQLTGRLEKWWKPQPGAGGGTGGSAPVGGQFIGEVVVTNKGADCTLQGDTAVRLLGADGREVLGGSESGINAEARDRVVPVPAGGTATLRVDWAGPFCPGVEPPYLLGVTLPHGGGELRAEVVPRDRPACGRDVEVPGQARSWLSTGAFEPTVAEDPQASVRSALWALTATVQGPAEGRAGAAYVYVVTLRNPSDVDVPLLPCPGYVQGVRALPATASQLYRLNCRARQHVPARGELRFRMVAWIPAAAPVGAVAEVQWRLVTPQQLPSEHLVGVLRPVVR